MNIEHTWLGPSALELVLKFHQAFNHPIATTKITDAAMASDLCRHRMDWMQEEMDEMWEAYRNNDVVGFVDALQDLKYFIYGTEIALGVPSEDCFNTVNDANMDKLGPDNKPSYHPVTGKVVKPEGWIGPEERLAALLL